MTDPKPNPDAAVMHGDPTNPGAGEPKPAAAAAPELVEIDLGGTKVKVDKATADAITAANEAHATELEQARAQAAARPAHRADPAAPAAAADDPLANIETELFANPRAALEKFGNVIRAEVTKGLTEQYQAEQARSAFWSEFYSENKDLAAEKLVVNAVAQRDWNKLLTMKAGDAAKALSRATKTELLRLRGDSAGDSAGRSGGKPAAEGGNEPGNLSRNRQSKPVDATKGPKSLTDVIKARRAARVAAATGQRPAAS